MRAYHRTWFEWKLPFIPARRRRQTLRTYFLIVWLSMFNMDTFQVRDVRHAVRCLRYADVIQTDWSGGDILCVRESVDNDGPLTPVLVDFAFAVQSELGYEVEVADNRNIVETVLLWAGVAREVLKDDNVWWPEDRVEF